MLSFTPFQSGFIHVFCTATLILQSNFFVLISWVLLKGVWGLFCSRVLWVLSTAVWTQLNSYLDLLQSLKTNQIKMFEKMGGPEKWCKCWGFGKLWHLQLPLQLSTNSRLSKSLFHPTNDSILPHIVWNIFYICKIAVWPKLSNMCVGELKVTPFNGSNFLLSPSHYYVVLLLSHNSDATLIY